MRVGGRLSLWIPKDFLRLGSRSAVDQALRRLTADGKIRRLERGLYDYPVRSAVVGVRAPTVSSLARAAARASGGRVQPTGAVAANALGRAGSGAGGVPDRRAFAEHHHQWSFCTPAARRSQAAEAGPRCDLCGGGAAPRRTSRRCAARRGRYRAHRLGGFRCGRQKPQGRGAPVP